MYKLFISIYYCSCVNSFFFLSLSQTDYNYYVALLLIMTVVIGNLSCRYRHHLPRQRCCWQVIVNNDDYYYEYYSIVELFRFGYCCCWWARLTTYGSNNHISYGTTSCGPATAAKTSTITGHHDYNVSIGIYKSASLEVGWRCCREGIAKCMVYALLWLLEWLLHTRIHLPTSAYVYS